MRVGSVALLLLALPAGSALRLGAPAALAPRGVACHTDARMGPMPQIAKPKTRQVTKSKPASGGGGGGKGAGAAQIAKLIPKTNVEEPPMYKVVMLNDEDYEEDPVCSVLVAVIPEIVNDRQAAEKYNECIRYGKAVLIVQPKELAEAYVEQLTRADPLMIVYSEIEEEKKPDK
jgi:ATP-dependent Clp protease adapter protein ClpS